MRIGITTETLFKTYADYWFENRDCNSCDLRKHCKGPVPGHGPFSADIMFVGESPGVTEHERGIPFTGDMGKQLRKVADRIGIDDFEEWAYATNVLKCQPAGDDPTDDEIEFCGSLWLEEELRVVSPSLVITIGRVAARYFLGKDLTMQEVSGRLFRAADTGRPFDIIPIFSPMAARHNPAQLADLEDGIAVASRWLSGEVEEESVDQYAGKEDYRILSSYAEFDAILREADTLQFLSYVKSRATPTGPGLVSTIATEGTYLRELMDKTRSESDAIPIALDLETYPNGDLYCWSFSLEPGTGYMVPGNGWGIDAFRAITESSKYLKIWHNAIGLDWQTLAANNIGHVAPFTDTMTGMYILGLQRQGLKFAAAKYLSMSMRDYSDLVAPYTRLRAIEYLRDAESYIDVYSAPEPEIVESWDKKTETLVQREKKGRSIASLIVSDLKKIDGEPAQLYKRDDPSGKYRAGDVRVPAKPPKDDFDPYALWVSRREAGNAGVLEVEDFLGPMEEASLADVFEHDPEAVKRYVCRDPDATFRLWLWQTDVRKTERQSLIQAIDEATLPLLMEMMHHGMKIDPVYLRGLAAEWRERMSVIQAEASAIVGFDFNPGSDDQIRLAIKRKKYRFVGKLTKSTKVVSMAKGVIEQNLERIEGKEDTDPEYVRFLKLLLEYSQLEKAAGTYAEALPNAIQLDGRVHTILKSTRVATGRLSSADPVNLQNIPVRSELGQRVRRGFTCEDGYRLWGVDLSQIELRVLAHVANEPTMIEVFRSGGDIHRSTAAEVNGIALDAVTDKQRKDAKAVNFGIVYGITAIGLSIQLGISEEEAQRYIDMYLNRFKRIKTYMNITETHMENYGYVEDLFGRRRYWPQLVHPDFAEVRPWELEAMGREAINMPIQSAAQGIIKIGMSKMRPAIDNLGIGDSVRFINQVHDEVLFEARDEVGALAAMTVIDALENAVTLRVPVLAEAAVGDNWAELEDIKYEDLLSMAT